LVMRGSTYPAHPRRFGALEVVEAGSPPGGPDVPIAKGPRSRAGPQPAAPAPAPTGPVLYPSRGPTVSTSASAPATGSLST